MTALSVECLGCGCLRSVEDDRNVLATGVCPRCGYVGWAHVADLSEADRRALRELPVPFRPLWSGSGSPAWR